MRDGLAAERKDAEERTGKMERQAFWAMVERDLLIQARDIWEFVFRVAMLPFILILTYGFMLPTLGVLPESFPSQMFAGMVGMCHYRHPRHSRPVHDGLQQSP
jgi:hypothetical protein